jgi:NADH:ubiquinone oxidoreductase subunit 6 (subunit J)
MIESGLFLGCALLAVVGALGAAVVRNLFHAALLLGMCLLGTAGLYLFLETPYLACVQVIVYVGGILVLILFATLFSADVLGASQRPRRALWIAAVSATLLAAVVAWRLAAVGVQQGVDLAAQRSAPGTAPDAIGGADGTVGDLLLGAWLVPFLVAGLLLTVALVGAVATVRRFRYTAEVSRA